MFKNHQIKHKHHYVWAYYLKGWSNNNDIWYISRKGNIVKDSIYGIACEKDFYKISFFTPEELEIARFHANLSNTELCNFHHQLINQFIERQYMFEALKKLSPKRQLLQNDENIFCHNFFEDILSKIESESRDYLTNMKSGNISFLDDPAHLNNFCNYIGFQFVRTKCVKELLTISFKPEDINNDELNKYFSFYNKHWWFACIYFAINLSYAIRTNRVYKFRLINNFSSEPFITSDQPVININSFVSSGEDIDLYYPISEQKALLVYSSASYAELSVIKNVEFVKKLNIEICKAAAYSIYTSSSEILKIYKPYFNQRKFRQYR